MSKKKFKMASKKAQHVPDMLDSVFLILYGILAVFLLTWMISGGTAKASERSLEKAADFNKIDSAISNLRVQAEEGIRIDPAQLEKKIEQSRVLDGMTITDCRDYSDMINCNKDTTGLYNNDPERGCQWDTESEKCRYKTQAVSGRMAK